MAEKLIGLEGVECNIDDILIHGKTQEEHHQQIACCAEQAKGSTYHVKSRQM